MKYKVEIWSAELVGDDFKAVSKEILGEEITPHYFRHRFHTEAAKARAPLADIRAISGLRDVEVLKQYYSHTTPDGQEKVLAVSKI